MLHFKTLRRATATALLLFGVVKVAARTADGRAHANVPKRPSVPIISPPEGPVTSKNGTHLPPYNTTYYFDQLIDHNTPSLGTFKQRYWHTYQFYEPGGPILLTTPGETNAAPYTAYLTNLTILGQVAQAQNGSAIVLEHRYYGESSPFDDLSDASLKYHTIQQAIDDLEYFAKNVKLPQPDGDAVAPGQAPWVLFGGSYAGALTSFTMVNKPDLFQAAYASSAVVESITDYWMYFKPIMDHMPKNCSADVQAAIKKIDSVFMSNDTKEIDAILTLFNMTALKEHLDDAAGALRNNLWDWQSLHPASGGGIFFDFCDALEVKDGVSADEKGWGADHAIQAWGSFWTSEYYSYLCDDEGVVSCLGSYNPKSEMFTNTTIGNDARSWTWIVCNEMGFYQEGAPEPNPTLVTRLVRPQYDERQCSYYFPERFANQSTPVPNVDATNKVYDGWFVKEKHLFFANGRRDPWKEATLAADGTNFQSTPDQPLTLSNGYHCSDLSAQNAVDPSVLEVQQQGIKYIAGWLAEWKPQTSGR
ncbi:peptidase S28 [Lentinus tigrinus ALCF2SS1-7]|uniref:Peptidase S28 n=1 Tax=Lentinus tigrinus ALCF2SS1-6 TaxID=1328759 RepID=A0A5C2S9N2_9APHY|nr:peptidase S28 [Lentinus tigrinus ALCF2SS1-6]RPD75817.1 peptidase S28 [Lentinus tigrinus ALCF2SS1-7]